MKIFAISVLSLLVILAVAGCNPVGMDKTRVYVTGIIYTDTLETTGAPGIGATAGICCNWPICCMSWLRSWPCISMWTW